MRKQGKRKNQPALLHQTNIMKSQKAGKVRDDVYGVGADTFTYNALLDKNI